MRKWQVADLKIDVNAVLRGQGADPDIIRERSPRLVAVAEAALEQAINRLEPRVLVEEFQIRGYAHDKLLLSSGKELSGALVAGHLVGANYISVVLCTMGSQIDQLAARVMEDDLVLGLAIDGVGSAAVEALANAVCHQIELDAASRGMETTIPLSPGMIGWGVEEGQPLIFDLINPSKHTLQLTPSCLMVPRKSLSMILGIGPHISSGEKICDYCAMRATCRYQDHYSAPGG